MSEQRNNTKRSTHVAARNDAARNLKRRAVPRTVQIVNLLVYLAAIATLAVVINFFARRSEFRTQIDATKTRAYSLSEQTQNLIESLDGQWTIAMVVSETGVSRSMRKQIDEVLRRYTGASPNIRVLRIDPDDPRSLRDYETLLRDLSNLYREDISRYDAALDAAATAFTEFRIFAQQRAIEVVAAAAALPEQDQTRRRLEQSAAAMQRIAEQGQEVLNAVNAARATTESQPIADYEGARSILDTALTSYANETDAVASILQSWQQRPNLGPGERAFAQNTAPIFEAESQRLALAADPLKHLPELELGDIGRRLGEGEAAVILSPRRATVIPSRQLFPKSNLTSRDDGGITFDQRFRGEQLLSAAIRSLTLDRMPMVAFVHAENDSILRTRDKNADVIGVAGALRSSRYEIIEWNVVKSPARPELPRGSTVAWVIVPPAPASSIEAPPAVRALYDAVDRLLAEGENVLLSVYPSLLAKYGQSDPLAMLARGFGIMPDTSTLIVENNAAQRGPRSQSQATLTQLVQNFENDSAIGRAVDGQLTAFTSPVPLRELDQQVQLTGADSASANATHTVLAYIEPSPHRWLETDWTSDLNHREPRPDQLFDQPIPIALAAERASPSGVGTQRVIVVGSGGWMITNVTNQVVPIGGEREALVYPGNLELMLTSVMWLAGLDDLIAASPLSQEVSRLRGITPEARRLWWWIVVAAVPAGCVLLGVGVWLWRRI